MELTNINNLLESINTVQQRKNNITSLMNILTKPICEHGESIGLQWHDNSCWVDSFMVFCFATPNLYLENEIMKIKNKLEIKRFDELDEKEKVQLEFAKIIKELIEKMRNPKESTTCVDLRTALLQYIKITYSHKEFSGFGDFQKLIDVLIEKIFNISLVEFKGKSVSNKHIVELMNMEKNKSDIFNVSFSHLLTRGKIQTPYLIIDVHTMFPSGEINRQIAQNLNLPKPSKDMSSIVMKILQQYINFFPDWEIRSKWFMENITDIIEIDNQKYQLVAISYILIKNILLKHGEETASTEAIYENLQHNVVYFKCNKQWYYYDGLGWNKNILITDGSYKNIRMKLKKDNTIIDVTSMNKIDDYISESDQKYKTPEYILYVPL